MNFGPVGIPPFGYDRLGAHACIYFEGYKWAFELEPLAWGLCVCGRGGSLRFRIGPLDVMFVRREDYEDAGITAVELPPEITASIAAMLSEAHKDGKIIGPDGKPIGGPKDE